METDEIAFRILEALEAEGYREPDKLKRKLLSVILGEVMEKYSLKGEQIDPAVNFMKVHHLIDGNLTQDMKDFHGWPSERGYIALLEMKRQIQTEKFAAAEKIKADNVWTLERAIKWIAAIVAPAVLLWQIAMHAS